MYKPDRDPSSPARPPRRRKDECCTDLQCESGLRNRYFEGKQLTAESFRVEQRYLLDRRRLLNRAIHGWGVVYGFGLKPVLPKKGERLSGLLQVGAGLALDECGRELVQASAMALSVDQVVVFDGEGRRIEASGDIDAARLKVAAAKAAAEIAGAAHGVSDQVISGMRESLEQSLARRIEGIREDRPRPTPRRLPVCWVLSVHYAEQHVAPTPVHDPCSCERTEWEQVCETVRYSLRPIDCFDCCDPQPCELQCDCSDDPCCGAVGQMENARERRPCAPVARGGCGCVCEHLTGLDPGGACCELCEIEEPCARVRVDLEHGVPLACLALLEDECGSWVFTPAIMPCGPRRMVKRNDLLFDLVRGCDLTRIAEIGWADWHRAAQPMDWPTFRRSFGGSNPGGEVVTELYWVRFSRPVRAQTVGPDCFEMVIVFPEEEGGWLTELRVPILRVETSGGSGVPAGHVTFAKLVVDGGWLNDALDSRRNLFNDAPTRVEMRVRGDYILDCNGQAVDANAVGRCAYPSGNGTPGGDFFSTWPVAMRGEPPRNEPPRSEQPRAQQTSQGA